jgi:hypothetical protein
LTTSTLELVRAALKSDPTITPAERVKTLALLRNGHVTKQNLPASPKLPSILRPAQAAERLSRSVRAVHRLCEEGLLQKVKFKGRTRCAGITSASLEALVNASSQQDAQ